MRQENYIVEGTNWKCKVSLDNDLDQKLEFKLFEAATKCIEHLFSNHGPIPSVDLIELTDSEGVDYFKIETDDESSVPDPSFGILTKVYKIKDIKNPDNHYVILTEKLMENASAYEAILLIDTLEKMMNEKNPQIYESVNNVMRDKLVFKYGDLKKFEKGEI